jgi:outer membrane cobalamin receptor
MAQQPPEPPKPEPLKTSITVVEKVSAETPANISVLNSSDLQETPGTNLDDRLREVPGFSLFRRSSSLVAHPTTQGISLRGIGSSGASRTLLLWDGIPANDPFGGWVYWTQFIPAEVETIEVTRGAATSIFGDKAMSGSIGIFSRQFDRLHLFTGYEGGNRDSHDVWLGLSKRWSRVAVSGAGRAFTTDGYYIVPEERRGPADTLAGVRFVTGDVRIDQYTNWGNLFVKGDALAEERKNGTQLTHNSTGLGTVSLRFERQFGDETFSLMGFHTREGFHSTFDSVTGTNRNIDTLSFWQSVPSDATGGAAMWQHHGHRWNLLGGADVDRMGGTSTEFLVPSGRRVGGGVQLQHGIFGQGDVTAGPVRFFGGLRHSFAGGDSRFWSPTGGISMGRKRLRARASAYRAFRSPTLNELYREFRVGNTATLANANLRPETVFGVEAGVDVIGESYSFRVTGYRNSLDSLITNVTLSQTATAIVRQRANAAEAISRGFETEFRERWRKWTGELQYLFADSRYVTGFRVAQVPKHQGSAQLTWRGERSMVSVSARSYSYQFDDDINTLRFRLAGYPVLQVAATHRLTKAFSADFALENALDRRFYTAYTPIPNIGAPRLWRVGVRWDGRL